MICYYAVNMKLNISQYIRIFLFLLVNQIGMFFLPFKEQKIKKCHVYITLIVYSGMAYYFSILREACQMYLHI